MEGSSLEFACSKLGSDQLAQYQAACSQWGWARLEGWTLLELLGRDRATLLHNLCTQEVRTLEFGQGREAFLTDVKGHILGHGLIGVWEDSLTWITAPGQAEVLLPHFDKYTITEDVRVEDRTGQWRALLATGATLEQELARLGATSPASQPGSCGQAVLGDNRCRLQRMPWGGLPAVAILADAETLPAVEEQLSRAGAVQVGQDVMEVLRVEAGYPLYGRDIGRENLPQEVGRDREAIHFQKGCYLGQETVARIDALGHVNRRLVGLSWPPGEAHPASELLVEGRPLGRLTSAVWSPALDGPLALGYVRAERAEQGTTFTVPAAAPTDQQLTLRVRHLPLNLGR